METILTVKSVELTLLKHGQQLQITAEGVVRTSGWTSPTLHPYVYIRPPQDGVYDFTFVAEPPQTPALQVLQPIRVVYVVPVTTNMRGVRVHAAENSVEALLERAVPEPA